HHLAPHVDERGRVSRRGHGERVTIESLAGLVDVVNRNLKRLRAGHSRLQTLLALPPSLKADESLLEGFRGRQAKQHHDQSEQKTNMDQPQYRYEYEQDSTAT